MLENHPMIRVVNLLRFIQLQYAQARHDSDIVYLQKYRVFEMTREDVIILVQSWKVVKATTGIFWRDQRTVSCASKRR